MPPTATLDADTDRINRRVLRGNLTPLPKRPKGDGTEDPETKRFVRKVSDLENPEDVCAAIRARANRAALVRADQEPDWRQAVRAWFQRPTTDREDGWESDRFLPLIFKHVETAIPALIAAILDGNRIWRFEALTPNGKAVARAKTRLVNWQAFTTSGAEEAYEDLVWWAALIGTSYADHGWDYREERRYAAVVRETVGPDGASRKVKEMTEQDVVVADTPTVRSLNPLDVYPDPDAVPGDDNEWYVQLVRTSIGALRDAAGQGHIDGEALEAWLAEWDPAQRTDEWTDDLLNDTWDDWLREIGHSPRDEMPDRQETLTDEKMVTVLRYRSKAEIVTLGSPTHILGYSLNPYAHGKTGIVLHQFFKVPGSAYGRGLGTALLGHQELANENINRWMDTAAVEANAPIIVDRAAVNILDDEWVFEPNKVIRARSTEAVKRMEVPAPTDLALKVDAHLAHDADDMTGFSEQARGLAPASGQTATAFQGLQSNIRTRLVLHLRRLARTIRLSGDLIAALDEQFLTKRQMVAITGEDGMEAAEVVIEPWEIVGKTVCRATLVASRASPDQRLQTLLALTQVAVPLFQSGAYQQPEIRAWLRTLLDEAEIENADSILPRQGPVIEPMIENEMLKRGMRVPVNPADDHMTHIAAHGQLHEEMLAAGMVGAASVVQEHAMKHALAASQMGQGMAGPGGAPAPGGGPPGAGGAPAASSAGMERGGNTPGERGGGMTDGGAARNGVPGVKSPGPISAPGRPPPAR